MIKEEEIIKIKKKLEEHEKRIANLEKNISKKQEHKERETLEIKEGIERLTRKIGVPEEKIKELFDFEGNTLTSVKVIGKNEKEKTQNIVLIVILGYKYFYGIEEILAKEIKRNVAENRISINNFATHLKEITPSLIRKKGVPKSPKTIYKLTVLGESTAREILKKLCE